MVILLVLWAVSLHADNTLAEHAKRANEAIARNDFTEAEREYRAVLAIDPALSEMRSNLGIALHMQGKYEQAQREFRAALHTNPRLFVPNYFLGIELSKSNRYRQARTFLEAALTLKPDNTETHQWLGATYIGLQEYDRAIHQYREVTKQDPQNVDALYAVGRIYITLMDHALKAISDGPENEYYGLLLLEAVAENEQWRKLVDTKLNRIVPANASAPVLHFELGSLNLRNGKIEEARQLFQQELAIDSNSFQAHYGLAQASLAVRKFDVFAQELKRAVTIRPEFFCPPPALQIKITSEALEAALQHSHDLLSTQFLAAQLDKENSFCAHLASYRERLVLTDKSAGKSPELLFREKRYDAVISLLENQSDLTPPRQWLLAQAYFDVGNFEQAANFAERVGMLPKFHYPARYLLSKSYKNLALRTLADIARIAPDSYRVHQLLAEAYFARHDMQGAIAEFAVAVQRKPDDAELLYALGRAYFTIAEFSQALAALEKSLELDSYNAEANFLAGKSHVNLERPSEALPLLERALQLDPSMVSARAELGKAHLRMNQWEAAAKELEVACSADAGGELYYELFRAYSKLNQTEKAERALAESKKRRALKFTRERSKLATANSP
jgi:tetratricopeptide (TPR) repeat protein